MAVSNDRTLAPLTDAKRRLIDRLKRVESATAPELATEFGLTDTAVRQHLDTLESVGLVERTVGAAAGRGRPPVHWRITTAAAELFPDRHAELAVEFVRAIRATLGEEALDRVLASRSERQLEQYRGEIDPTGPVGVRVRRLAELRTAEGYLAEAVDDDERPGSMVLVEHHCPVCDVASTCDGLCRSELELFRRTLGPNVAVERTQHLLAGDARCAYRVSPT